MNIIVGLAALAVLLVLTLDAFGVLPAEPEPEVIEEAPFIEDSIDMQSDQLLFKRNKLRTKLKRLNNNG